jgi:hypothetical protein
MAAPAEGRAARNASLNRETKAVAAKNSRRCDRTGSEPVSLAVMVALLLASPQSAVKLARGGFGAHLPDVGSIRVIESESFGE